MAEAKPTTPPRLTASSGAPVDDNRNSITAGPRGPVVLMQDWWLSEKMAHFNRERIPERIVRAKDSAAYGTPTITQDLSRYCKAKLFSRAGNKDECFLRFSTVAVRNRCGLSAGPGHQRICGRRAANGREWTWASFHSAPARAGECPTEALLD